MKKTLLLLCSALAICLAACNNSAQQPQPQTIVQQQPAPQPVVVEQAPAPQTVYVQPQPQTVVVHDNSGAAAGFVAGAVVGHVLSSPRPVYVAPRAYYAPRPVYVTPRYSRPSTVVVVRRR